MAKAVTEKFEELILDIETAPGSGIYAPVCGLIDCTITRTANVDTAEVPDCADESLPLSVERQVRSIEVTVSGTGVWARESQDMLKQWFYSSATKNIRVRDTAAASGDAEIESGPALLTTLTNTRTKGQKVSCEIELAFDGQPTLTDKA
ncbi:phage tail tube protein [Mesorhizobium retamae]|uniref:Phage tail protein n=1 Tax=Mesorhizobium retamae TaxID=2912854 RepID=A0ABS9QI19_9HYPH|nr:phage tail tube protein [Mesorhizobium sp. IRAMC:0171]MCG7507061.1 phage tail protein [Mesorhizobium sp. IRAMC:0171]